MRMRTLATVGLTAALLTLALGLLCGCESTTTDPWTGLDVTREQLAANKEVREAQARATALEAAASEQAKKDAATRAARTALSSVERTTVTKVERLDAEHASQVRDIRATAEDAVAKIQASVEDVTAAADFNIAKANRDLEAEHAKIAGLFAGAGADLDKKDARTALLTGGLVEAGNIGVPILAAAAGPAGGAVTGIWGLVSAALLGGGTLGGAGMLTTRLQKKKTLAEAAAREKAEEAAATTRSLAERAFDAIEVAKKASPAFADAWKDVRSTVAEFAGEDATKFVHDLKEFGKPA